MSEEQQKIKARIIEAVPVQKQIIIPKILTEEELQARITEEQMQLEVQAQQMTPITITPQEFLKTVAGLIKDMQLDYEYKLRKEHLEEVAALRNDYSELRDNFNLFAQRNLQTQQELLTVEKEKTNRIKASLDRLDAAQ